MSLVFRVSLAILRDSDGDLNLMNVDLSSDIIWRYEDKYARFLHTSLILGHQPFKKHTPKEASNGLFNAVSMETESARRVIRTSFWLTDETPPRRREDSSIPTDVGIETATTKLRVRRRSSWATAAPEDASPLKTSSWMCWNQPEGLLFGVPAWPNSPGAQANTKVSICVNSETCLGCFHASLVLSIG